MRLAVALARYGVPTVAFASSENASFALDCRRDFDAGRRISDADQYRFYAPIRPALPGAYPLAEPCLVSWLAEAEQRRDDGRDIIRRMRLSICQRWSGLQDQARPLTDFADATDFEYEDPVALLQLLSRRAALLLDVHDPVRDATMLDRAQRRALVATSRSLLARAAPLQPGIEPRQRRAGEPEFGEWFMALCQRAERAAYRLGMAHSALG